MATHFVPFFSPKKKTLWGGLFSRGVFFWGGGFPLLEKEVDWQGSPTLISNKRLRSSEELLKHCYKSADT